ncbi:MAG: HesA/MoeB/ThiF family protein [Bacteroidetes bacterium]|nr:HesA/MoeB/ThiF family protein [Bacteroidota bacterium]MBS1973206.1 HesA/MoeB/ThiF family protein [Bacteroidota bacterium]
MSRFERQIILPGFGAAGQEKLRQAKVLVIGAGGLGCPALLYLAAAGVGTIGIADGDVVAVSNLNRQIIFGEGDVGKMKAEVAAGFLQKKYSDIRVEAIPKFLTASNSLPVIGKYDLVLDGSDNFPTRYMVNDACVLLSKPIILGAIYQNEGQVAVLNVMAEDQPLVDYRDLYPEPPAAYEIPNCNETGVLGVLPGIIGTMQAAETIKLLSGYGKPMINKVLVFRLPEFSFYEMGILPNAASKKKIPANAGAFAAMDYSIACAATVAINWGGALSMQSKYPDNVLLVDVREIDEKPVLKEIECINIPLSVLEKEYGRLLMADSILLFCHSGIRSEKAAYTLKKFYPAKNIYSIQGGLMHPQSPIHHQHHVT